MDAGRRKSPRRVIGFSFCPRYLGMAAHGSGAVPMLRPARIKHHARERGEHVRLAAWIERAITRHDAELVAILRPEEGGETTNVVHTLLRTVAERNCLPLVEVSRAEVGQVLGAEGETNTAICARLAEQHAALAAALERRGVRSFFGPRTEAARYWAMPLLAFGAVLCVVHLVAESASN